MVNQHQVDQNTPIDDETQSLAIGVETVATATQHQDANIQRTLAIIKPDAMQANKKDAILDKIDESNFIIVKERELHLTKEQAGLFYREHEGKPFYDELTTWMSSGPIHALVLEKTNAIRDWRELMGPTDPNKAREIEPNSLRALFGTDGMNNATHGSDCQTSAEREIDIIFNAITTT
ncbi:nucleoside diphosphate kinase, partial [Lichtheimia hyalospora FSU 10163]